MFPGFQGISLEEEQERQAFALRAAEAFGRSDDLPGASDWFAVLWGLHGRAVLVFKISGDGCPVNYHDIVPWQGDGQ